MTAAASEKMTLIAGPCVLEDEGLALEVAQELKRQLAGLPVDLYFKASFDKANRTSHEGFRGPGIEKGLEILADIKAKVGLPLLTDIHLPDQAKPAAEVIDFLQIPAFLCRQTDLITAATEAALKHGRKLNVKKGQFLAPWDVKNIIEKVSAIAGSSQSSKMLHITERGTSFGYNTLVVDMTGIPTMRKLGVPVIIDATHSLQSPGAGPSGKSTGGRREYVEVIARSAMAAGADGIFMECHPRPDKAKSDAATQFPLEHAGELIRQVLAIRSLVASQPQLVK